MRHSTAGQETCPLQRGWSPNCWSVFLIIDFAINAIVKEIDVFLGSTEPAPPILDSTKAVATQWTTMPTVRKGFLPECWQPNYPSNPG